MERTTGEVHMEAVFCHVVVQICNLTVYSTDLVAVTLFKLLAAASVIIRYQATCTLCSNDNRVWFWAASQMRIGLWKHQIASFPATSGQRHKSQPFTKFSTTSCCRALHSHLYSPYENLPNRLIGYSCLFCLLGHKEYMSK